MATQTHNTIYGLVAVVFTRVRDGGLICDDCLASVVEDRSAIALHVQIAHPLTIVGI